MENYFHLDSITSALQQVALRYCWVTDCDYVFQEEFDIDYMAFSTVCGSDTVFATSHVEVEPPLGQVEPTPNVFTPNTTQSFIFNIVTGSDLPLSSKYDELPIFVAINPVLFFILNLNINFNACR